MTTRSQDDQWMQSAIQIAAQGQGRVEPNPMVGCVVVRDNHLIASGYHEAFGGPHAEVNALHALSEEDLRDATLYVTLEPCCHFGKTPPCVDMLLKKRPSRIVVAQPDPYPEVSGKGIQRLRDHGFRVDVGILEREANLLNAPYRKLLRTGMPWVIAKWAMTLDGAIATGAGNSQWISNEQSRAVVHTLRSRVDAIVVGIGTVLADDPLLTTRLPDGEKPKRIATRVVMDSQARLPSTSHLLQTIDQAPVLVVTSAAAPFDRIQKLRNQGCRVLEISEASRERQLLGMLQHLGQMRYTNVLIEGGGTLLGNVFDLQCIDEVHTFIAPKIVGGFQATRPIGGNGREWMNQALQLDRIETDSLDGDVYVRGICKQAADLATRTSG